MTKTLRATAAALALTAGLAAAGPAAANCPKGLATLIGCSIGVLTPEQAWHNARQHDEAGQPVKKIAEGAFVVIAGLYGGPAGIGAAKTMIDIANGVEPEKALRDGTYAALGYGLGGLAKLP